MPEDPLSPASPVKIDIRQLSAAFYEDLRRLARSRLRSNGPLTLLDTTGLVSETYERLAAQHGLLIDGRASFLGYCSRIMRSVIVDLIRERNADRRGSGQPKFALTTSLGEALAIEDDPLWVDEALADLAACEPRLARVVEMRYFGGYTDKEIAAALGLTVRTVQRDLEKAQAVLRLMLEEGA